MKLKYYDFIILIYLVSWHKINRIQFNMSDEENVVIRFVIPKEVNGEDFCSEDMKVAFQMCVEHELSPDWISENSCSALQPTKQDVFVFQQFRGDVFSQFQKLKCVLLGPRCLLSCLMEGVPIPESRSPIFTTAMRGLVVTTTNFAGTEKEDLVNKIEYMGALFSPKLVGGTTHLIAKNVLSVKYEKAVEKSLSVMTEKWVTFVWEESCKRNVRATDPEFQTYKCPVFHGLTVTCSNLPRQEKELIRNLINDNGGIFSGQLECERTKLLVVTSPTGEKYKYAREWKLPCVLPTWIHESVKEGYAVAVEPYLAPHKEAVKCSTPNADETQSLPNFSMVSSIAGGNATHVNETVADTTIRSFLSKGSAVQRQAPKQRTGSYCEVLERLDLKEAKKVGLFLDGCNVYLSGFNVEQTEKLRRLLNGGGATRFNEISDSVTHVIIGEVVATDVKTIKSSHHRPYVLTVDWLVESIKLKCPASEERFLCTDMLLQPTEPPSPLSKKGLQMLRRQNDRPVPSFQLDDENDADHNPEKTLPVTTDLVDQYLNNSPPEQNSFPELEGDKIDEHQSERTGEAEVCNKGEDVTLRPNRSRDTLPEQDSTQCTESTIVPVFSDLKFFVIDFDDEVKDLLMDAIVSRGGVVVSKTFRGIADYAIVPLHGAEFTQTATEVVTYLWVEDCHLQDELVPVMYYHRPISIEANKNPLSGCVIGISSYTGKERDFIFSVAQLLGAVTQEMFARKNNEKKNALASTHLICSEPGSPKYTAALKWNLPAVSHEWLLACAKESRHVCERPYLVGESTCAADVSCKPTEISTPRRNASVVKERDGDNPAVNHSAKLESKAINKRIVELQTNAVMGPPVSPADRQGSSPQENNQTPSYRNCRGFSQESPLNIPKLLEGTPKNNAGESSQATPKGPYFVSTPQTPYGQVLKPNPSPQTRKNWKKWIDNFPDFEKDKSPPRRKRKNSTPLSELKRRCWDMILPADKKPAADGFKTDPDKEGRPGSAQNSTSSSSSGSQTPTGASSGSTGSVPQSVVHSQLEKLNHLLSRQSDGSDNEQKVKRVWSGELHPHEDNDISDKKVDSVKDPHAKESQALVDWDDPLIVNEQKRKSLGSNSSSQQSLKFMLSGIVDREHYESIIQSLGGEVTDKSTFDPSATHLVCSRPVRSEKLLASIASGKWVLHKSYLDDSLKEKFFIKENDYEWGNPSAISLMRDIKPGSLEHDLALSAHRWRCALTSGVAGAFMGMSAIVCISREREEPFKRLILAGGGRLVDFSNLDEGTHCFVELNKVALPVDLSIFAKKRIPCVPPLYLNDYLIRNPPPQAHSCVVPEYKQLLHKC